MHIILNLLLKNVPPKDTKPYFLNNISQRHFSRGNFSLHGMYVSFVAVVIFLSRVYIYIILLFVPAHITGAYILREKVIFDIILYYISLNLCQSMYDFLAETRNYSIFLDFVDSSSRVTEKD